MEIRKLLNIINENSGEVKGDGPFSDTLNVMTLGQFLNLQGIEPAGEQEEEIDEAEHQKSLFKRGELPRQDAPKKPKEFDMGKWMDKYLELEDENFHSECVLLCAKLVGTPEDVETAKDIVRQQKRVGHMPNDLYNIRQELDKRLYPKVQSMFNRWAANNPDKLEALEQKWGHSLNEAKLDAPARKVGSDEMRDYLKRIMGTSLPGKGQHGRPKYVSGKTKADKFKKPYIHRSSVIPIVDQNGEEYDLDALKTLIKKRPTKILKQNEKMQHSDGTASVFYNIGLPALKGLAVDEDSDEFVIIDTCPGAGACQTYCYAMKGGYIQWKNVAEGQSQLLNFLYNDPDGFMAMLGAEIEAADKKFNKKDKKTKLVIRWHDAGDFFSPQYLEMAYNVARSYPKVDFYAYTKLASVAQGDRPDNFKMNFSMGAKPAQEKSIDFETTKNSRVVPDALFKDLLDRQDGKVVYKDQQSINQLKQRIAAKYSVKPDSILTYDEMMKTPQSDEKGKWNVIVKPGDGDDSANRGDVLNSFLLIH